MSLINKFVYQILFISVKNKISYLKILLVIQDTNQFSNFADSLKIVGWSLVDTRLYSCLTD